jgi:hypothetical protein
MLKTISSIPGVWGHIGPYEVALNLSSQDVMSVGFSSLFAVANGIPRNSHAPVGEISPVMAPHRVAIV